MTRPVRLSASAAAWLTEEISYIADRNPPAARKLAARMREARRMLSEHPRAGRIGEIPGTRRLIVGPYVLTFRIGRETVDVIAIRHARQADAHAPKQVGDEA